jgi:DNA-binding CsgD family transcriptional regulator
MTQVRAREQILQLCRTPGDARTLRLEVLAVLRRAVGFDAHVWLMTDPETSVGSAPLADVPCLPELPQLIRLKYLTPVNRWTAMVTPVATLHQATGGDLARSRLWRDMLSRYQIGDVATSVHRDRFGCWAFLDLWREQTSPPFTAAEAEFLHGLAGPLTTALRSTQAAAFTAGPTGASAAEGPVVLLLSPALEVRSQTPQTQHYLRLLVPPDDASQAPVPAGAYNVGAQLLAREAGVDGHEPLARVHLGGGRWLTLRAARLDSPEPVAGRDIAVSIETTSPDGRVSLFTRACGLSARESELVGHVVAGAATRDIARLMFLSEHTVQDHLKSIFAKTGTRTRRALLATVLGT